jgi:predicted naringenin-chalcone synthase
LAKIISISTVVPAYQHKQADLLQFMERAYDADDTQKRILRYLYQHSGIETRYSVIGDYTLPMPEWTFFPRSDDLEPFPDLEQRLEWFQQYALPLSLEAAMKCIEGKADKTEITHLITVSCTGMSAPGLELQLMEAMQLNASIYRTAINFMGCYAAIHALKQASQIIAEDADAKVLIVCTELCTLHFQKTFSENSVTAPLLFGDGAAAVLVANDTAPQRGLGLKSFYSEILKEAKNDMSWNLSSKGFIMALSGVVPEIFQKEIEPMKQRALAKAGLTDEDIKYWCVHPGGKRILQGIAKGLSLKDDDLEASYLVLKRYGNMSSPTILFVLKEMWDTLVNDDKAHIFGIAFGPGLTMESLIMTVK